LLGIHYSHSGISLTGAEIWLEDRGVRVAPEEILAGPRVGVDYAGEDAGRPYRFRMTTKRQVP
jgi:DNA-3-methyladenine glycosylase